MTPVQKTFGAAACVFAVVASVPAVQGVLLAGAAKRAGHTLPLKESVAYTYGIACVTLGVCALKNTPK